MVTKLDRLARSIPDARNIVAELTDRGARLSIGGSVHDPADPVGRLLFNVLATVAECEGDLIARVRARAWRSLRPGDGCEASPRSSNLGQEAHLVAPHDAGEETIGELAEQSVIGHAKVYRAVDRARARPSGSP